MTAAELQFVRTVIARKTIRALAQLHENLPQNMPENIPGEWSAEDSKACWDEYIAMCREHHLRGEPVPAFFLSKRRPAQ